MYVAEGLSVVFEKAAAADADEQLIQTVPLMQPLLHYNSQPTRHLSMVKGRIPVGIRFKQQTTN